VMGPSAVHYRVLPVRSDVVAGPVRCLPWYLGDAGETGR
jgi:hypothetical protein